MFLWLLALHVRFFGQSTYYCVPTLLPVLHASYLYLTQLRGSRREQEPNERTHAHALAHKLKCICSFCVNVCLRMSTKQHRRFPSVGGGKLSGSFSYPKWPIVWNHDDFLWVCVCCCFAPAVRVAMTTTTASRQHRQFICLLFPATNVTLTRQCLADRHSFPKKRAIADATVRNVCECDMQSTRMNAYTCSYLYPVCSEHPYKLRMFLLLLLLYNRNTSTPRAGSVAMFVA